MSELQALALLVAALFAIEGFERDDGRYLAVVVSCYGVMFVILGTVGL